MFLGLLSLNTCCKMAWVCSGEAETSSKWSNGLSGMGFDQKQIETKTKVNQSFHICSWIFLEGDIYLRSIVRLLWTTLLLFAAGQAARPAQLPSRPGRLVSLAARARI